MGLQRLLTVVVSGLLCVHVLSLAGGYVSRAHAQVEPDEGFDDDDTFDEPNGPQRENPNIPGGAPGFRKGTPPGRGFNNNNFQNNETPQSFEGSGGSGNHQTLGPSSDGAVKFQLVDPPQYWHKKKHRRRTRKPIEPKADTVKDTNKSTDAGVKEPGP